jgi:predicted lipid-binding transport protein (Tim44 family)
LVGAVSNVPPLASPQDTTGLVAEQLASVWPVPEPRQNQFQGPVPVTEEELPVLHKLDIGTLMAVVPLTDPQAPLMGAGGLLGGLFGGLLGGLLGGLPGGLLGGVVP